MDIQLAKRLFVVAAHPDDDVIGCGGTISHVVRGGGSVHVAYLTDGSRSHPGSRRYDGEAIRALREGEAVAALAELGVTTEPAFFRLPDGALGTIGYETRSDTIVKLSRMIAEFAPDLIVAPWRRDPHCDHIAGHAIARDAARLAGYAGDFASYEVWLPIRGDVADAPQPGETRGFRIAIDRTAMAEKERALLAHRSQTSDLIDDDPTSFRIDNALMARWITPIERLFYERVTPRALGPGVVAGGC